MFRVHKNIIIGLNISHLSMLRLAVPQIAACGRRFCLIIRNDNPRCVLRRRDVRRLGYRGALHIINSGESVGALRSRFELLGYAHSVCRHAKWIIFCDGDGILTNTDIPNTGPNNFAVIQNAAVVLRRLVDLYDAIDMPRHLTIDGENVVLARPNMAIAGTIFRTDILWGLCDMLSPLWIDMAGAGRITNMALSDAIMWEWINIYARHVNVDNTPIYMDDVNYIRIALDRAAAGYTRAAAGRIVARYGDVLAAALRGTDSNN